MKRHVDTVQSAVELFRALRYDAKGCSNGKEAIRLVGEFDPDAVIMDISMPQVSGWDAARAIREGFPGKRPLLIALTGECKGAADLIVSKMNGFDHYFLPKPSEPARLGPNEKGGHRAAFFSCGTSVTGNDRARRG